MTKFKIYAVAFARIIVIFAGYIFLAPAFLLTTLGHLGELYTNALFAFVAQTKTLLASFEQALNNPK